MRNFTLICVLALTACTVHAPTDKSISSHSPKVVSEPNNQQTIPTRHCTMQYKPVCAIFKQNGQNISKTFGNYCMAQAFGNNEISIVEIRDGECQESSSKMIQ